MTKWIFFLFWCCLGALWPFTEFIVMPEIDYLFILGLRPQSWDLPTLDRYLNSTCHYHGKVYCTFKHSMVCDSVEMLNISNPPVSFVTLSTAEVVCHIWNERIIHWSWTDISVWGNWLFFFSTMYNMVAGVYLNFIVLDSNLVLLLLYHVSRQKWMIGCVVHNAYENLE